MDGLYAAGPLACASALCADRSSASISPRVRLVPAPRRFDDRLDRGVLRRPIEKLAGKARIGNQFRRIAGAARRGHGGNRMAGDFPAGVDHLTHAVAAARAEIDLDRLSSL